MLNKDLKRRILEISYKHNLSHLGSCLTAVDIIEEIYQTKKRDEKFVLSSGHAGLALFVVLEKHGYGDAEKMFEAMGVHPERGKYTRHIEGTVDGEEDVIDCSTGSLGQGLPIAVGMALADRSKNVYCLISDGECAEGSTFEAVNVIQREEVDNLKLYVNFNGWAAYRSTEESIMPQIGMWYKTNVDDFPFLNGLDAHYYVMNEQDYRLGTSLLK